MGLPVRQIQRYAEADALEFADEIMGSCPCWRESLRVYRWADSFAEEWKVEAGRWLLFARDQGFLDALVEGYLAEERVAASRRTGGEDKDAARRLSKSPANPASITASDQPWRCRAAYATCSRDSASAP